MVFDEDYFDQDYFDSKSCRETLRISDLGGFLRIVSYHKEYTENVLLNDYIRKTFPPQTFSERILLTENINKNSSRILLFSIILSDNLLTNLTDRTLTETILLDDSYLRYCDKSLLDIILLDDLVERSEWNIERTFEEVIWLWAWVNDWEKFFHEKLYGNILLSDNYSREWNPIRELTDEFILEDFLTKIQGRIYTETILLTSSQNVDMAILKEEVIFLTDLLEKIFGKIFSEFILLDFYCHAGIYYEENLSEIIRLTEEYFRVSKIEKMILFADNPTPNMLIAEKIQPSLLNIDKTLPIMLQSTKYKPEMSVIDKTTPSMLVATDLIPNILINERVKPDMLKTTKYKPEMEVVELIKPELIRAKKNK
jgi:hypothetical protein